MLTSKTVQGIVAPIAIGIARDGGELKLVSVTAEEVTVTYVQPTDCGDMCSMPEDALQRMLQAMLQAHAGRSVRVVVHAEARL